MKKDIKIFTGVRLEESLLRKAKRISKKETGENSISDGIRLAIRAYDLKGK